ncbi:MAG: response regulator [Azovibrio sp.]|uniref:sigma-54-dependent transcriptional regulator n=1 Tax=Azovibrio sp. TaxID=1872673 RepID=UPI003C74A67F
MAEILVVDDEIGIRELLSEILADEGHDVRLAENAAAARQIRSETTPDLVLLDIWMPDTDGISLLKEWSAAGLLTMPVVMMSGHGTIDTAVEATRIGAVDFLEKPIALQKLLSTVKKALKHDHIGQRPPLTLDALAHAALFRDLKKRLEQAAAKTSILMLKGGSGPIAEICARTLQRPQSPWLDLLECTAPMNQELLQKTAGGLIYVSDLASLGKLQQMNLAFALERVHKHNILLVAASSQSLTSLGSRGWDAQLLARLGEVWLALPNLNQHADELPEVIGLFLTQMVERQEVPLRHFSSAALNLLRVRKWPNETGWNDLQALIRNLALTALEEEITEADIRRLLPEAEQPQATLAPEGLRELFEHPLREARDAFERHYFEHLLRAEGGNMTRVADRSGLERTHLYRKLKLLGVAVGRRSGEENGT